MLVYLQLEEALANPCARLIFSAIEAAGSSSNNTVENGVTWLRLRVNGPIRSLWRLDDSADGLCISRKSEHRNVDEGGPRYLQYGEVVAGSARLVSDRFGRRA